MGDTRIMTSTRYADYNIVIIRIIYLYIFNILTGA